VSVAAIVGVVLTGAIAVWAVSYVVEFWRKRPRAPAALSWAGDAVVRCRSEVK
jgi:hypothetical protein